MKPIPTSQRRVSILRACTLVLSFFVGTCTQTQLWAQYNIPQSKVWTFAKSKGVRFSPGPGPVSIITSSFTEEGSASVSDNSGNLLFYTEGAIGFTGAKVHDKTGALMPNGSAIVPFRTFSCTQAAAIVPVVGNPNRYYVFSLEQGGEVTWYNSIKGCRLYYCIVDMSLNGGLGDVIASTIATPLDSGLCEKMTVVRGNNCDIWLLTHKKDLPHFKAYNISSSGISAPVVSTATGEIPTGANAYKIGAIKVSPDRTMIANCVMNGAYGGGSDRLELLQFNATTGIVSGSQVLNNFINQYDAEFSPDNSKLYVHIMGSRVYQYNLSLLPSITAVIASEFLVYTSPDWGGQMKLGPNGKIYLQTGSVYLDCINSPNLAGSLCNYSYHAVTLAGIITSTGNLGMPNMQIANPGNTIETHTDTTLCALASTLYASSGASWYTWSTGATTPSIIVPTTGIYWVKGAHGCDLHIDTFNVIIAPLTVIPTVTTASFCTGSSVILTAPSGYIAHVWNTGATTSSITVTTVGTYRVADTNLTACTLQTDTFHVTATPLVLVPTVSTIDICSGTSAVLAAPPGFAAPVWNTGATTPTVMVTTAGAYWVADTNLITCSVQIDTFHVTTTPLTLIPIVTTANFCTGSSATLTAPPGYIAHVWNTGATTSSITVTAAGTYRVADTNLSTCILQTDTFHVTVTPLTLIPAATTTGFCTGSSTILTAPPGYTAHVWNTGATSSSLTVTTPGTYWVADTVFSACILFTDTFRVTATPLTLIPAATTTGFCTGSSIILSAPSSYTAHVWNTGATTSSVTVTTPGTYWVTDTNLTTCAVMIDSFYVSAIEPPIVVLENDTIICLGNSIVLSSPMSLGSFLWSTGSTEVSITVQTGGTYYLSVTKQGCNTSDTIKISQLAIPSPIALGRDTILCKGDVFILRSGSDATSWSTGVVANSIDLTTSGTYSATVTNACGSSTSYVNISFEPCDLDFPNAFTPNNDGRNDLARAIGHFSFFKDYTLSIYNRFGQRVFYTEDIYAGWDGKFNGIPQDLGTYFYMIRYALRGKPRMLKGDLTLVR